MTFCLLYFRQFVAIWTTQSYNHFAGHYNFDQILQQIMVMSLITDFLRDSDPPETISAWLVTPLKFEYCRFSWRIRVHMRNGLRL
jgi:hypothetical protein